MISIKNRQLDTETINVLNEIVEMDIKAIEAFKLMKIIKHLDEVVQNRQKAEMNLVKKYAIKNEDGSLKLPLDENGNEIQGSFEVSDEDKEEFNKQFNDLLEYENKIDFDPIKFENLGLEKISIKKLVKLDFLFTE